MKSKARKLIVLTSFFLSLQSLDAFQTNSSNLGLSKKRYDQDSVLINGSDKKYCSHLFRPSTKLYDQKNDNQPNYIQGKLQDVNQLEIRLDATLASCYNLCRFLIFDVTTGAKDVPGWQLSDLILLGGAFSSCVVLSFIWTVVGVYTGIFEDRDENDLWNVASTASIVGPLWLMVEIIAGWPPSGVLLANELNGFNVSDVLNAIATGTLGLASIMCIGKSLTAGWR